MKAVTDLYWQCEKPEVFSNDYNVFRWYKKAERLQVSLPDYDKNGVVNQGKTVTISIPALDKNARAFLVNILKTKDGEK